MISIERETFKTQRKREKGGLLQQSEIFLQKERQMDFDYKQR